MKKIISWLISFLFLAFSLFILMGLDFLEYIYEKKGDENKPFIFE
jgi:hypothetical protein